MSKKVEMFQCERCGHTFTTEYYAEECEFRHKKEDFANYMFRNGYCLRMIQATTGVLYGLPKELYSVDTKTKFEIGYLPGKDGYLLCCQLVDLAGLLHIFEHVYRSTVPTWSRIIFSESKNDASTIHHIYNKSLIV